jgi:hypothetical protein
MTTRELEGWVEATIGVTLLGAIIALIWHLGEVKNAPQKIEGVVVEKVMVEVEVKDETIKHNGHRIPVVVVYPRRWELVIEGDDGRGHCQVSREAWDKVSVGEMVDCGEINGEGE